MLEKLHTSLGKIACRMYVGLTRCTTPWPINRCIPNITVKHQWDTIVELILGIISQWLTTVNKTYLYNSWLKRANPIVPHYCDLLPRFSSAFSFVPPLSSLECHPSPLFVILPPSCANRQRVWILRHVAMGYSVHLQRLLGTLTWGLYPYLINGYTDHTLEGSRLRSRVFASCEVFVSSLLVDPP